MNTQILDGRSLAKEILADLKAQISKQTPGLCTILVGEDPASKIYVQHKIKQAKEIGFRSVQYFLDASILETDLLKLIHEANRDPKIDGILVQLPLPPHIQTETILQAINPLKDIDGFHPENIGLLSIGKPRFIPCTPKGCMHLIQASGLDLLGCHAVIIGRSNIVGKPLAHLLMNSDATVTVCHHNTQNLKSFTQQADLLISAAGSPQLIQPDFIKPGAVIIDIGINKLPDGKLVGDVDTQGALSIAQAITPVPGGVGPMTLAMLMENTWEAYKLKQN